MFSISHINHLALTVKDMPITLEFYIRDPDQNLIEIANKV